MNEIQFPLGFNDRGEPVSVRLEYSAPIITELLQRTVRVIETIAEVAGPLQTVTTGRGDCEEGGGAAPRLRIRVRNVAGASRGQGRTGRFSERVQIRQSLLEGVGAEAVRGDALRQLRGGLLAGLEDGRRYVVRVQPPQKTETADGEGWEQTAEVLLASWEDAEIGERVQPPGVPNDALCWFSPDRRMFQRQKVEEPWIRFL